jgi:hypothetical protein
MFVGGVIAFVVGDTRLGLTLLGILAGLALLFFAASKMRVDKDVPLGDIIRGRVEPPWYSQ